jgi:uncharacterized protein
MGDNFTEFVYLLSPAEWVGLLLVLGGSFVLWGLLLRILACRLAARLRGLPPPQKPRRAVRWAVYLLCLTYAATYLYGHFVEADKLVLRHLAFDSSKIPAGRALRLVHVTDIHAQAWRIEHLERAAEAIVDLTPDAVLLTGDYLCDYTRGGPTALLAFLTRLPDVPIIAVPGNYGGRMVADPLFETLGMDFLHTETRLLTVAGVPLEVHGASPRRKPMDVRRRQAPERLGIFLEHFPSLLPSAAAADWDLFLAGHTHGGQIRLPGYGAIITLDRLGKTFEWGAYRVANTVAYVNAGLGLECRGAPQVRLFCPPEIALIEITGTGPPQSSSPK